MDSFLHFDDEFRKRPQENENGETGGNEREKQNQHANKWRKDGNDNRPSFSSYTECASQYHISELSIIQTKSSVSLGDRV